MSRRTLHTGARLLALACAGAILVLTLTPLGAGPAGAGGDVCALGLPCTAGHFVAFAALGVALAGWYAASDAAARSPQRVLVMLLLALWLFAAADELAQGAVGRDAQVEDWVVDMAGALSGLLGGSLLLRTLLRGLLRRR